MAQPARIFNLRHNSSERTPRRWLFFDTETFPQANDGGEHHTLRLWAAELVERGVTPRPGRATSYTGTTAAQLAGAVEACCRSGETLWICAHNLGFDLATTALPLELVARGWELTQHALASASPWLRMRRRDAGITMVDSYSWLPAPLEQLGRQVGTDKPPIADFAGVEDAVLKERCAADVRILREAMTTLLDWWEQGHLGHWSTTGPGCGFNSWRHTRMITKVVINQDPELRAMERGLIYGGRCEVWRTGRLDPGLYAYVDFEHTFGSICATESLPRAHARRFDSLELDNRVLSGRWIDLVAQVHLATSTPRYPLRTKRGVIHPVGEFTTALCGPEIREANRRGELKAIGPGLMYCIAPHMAGWGRWALDIVDRADPGQSEVVRTCVKAWTRTVPGRWAGRTGRTILELEQPVPGWRIEHGHTGVHGEAISILDMGGRRYWIAQDQDMDRCFPAILAWIQSHVRVRLSQLLDLVGHDAVVLCNTDGLIVDLERLWANGDGSQPRPRNPQAMATFLELELARWAQHTVPLVPRVKWLSRNLEVLSPQHVITDHSRQLSGVPRAAEEVAHHVYAFTDWPRLTTQLELDQGAGYQRRRRVVDLSHVPVLRWMLADGRTAPVSASGRLGEPCRLLPWAAGSNGASGAVLADRQHPLLTGLVEVE